MNSLYSYLLESLSNKEFNSIKKSFNKKFDPTKKLVLNNIKYVKKDLTHDELLKISKEINFKELGYSKIPIILKQSKEYLANKTNEIDCTYTIFIDIKTQIPLCIIGLSNNIAYEEGFKHIVFIDYVFNDNSILNNLFKTYVEEIKKDEFTDAKGITSKYINNIKESPIKYNMNSFEQLNKKEHTMHLIF